MIGGRNRVLCVLFRFHIVTRLKKEQMLSTINTTDSLTTQNGLKGIKVKIRLERNFFGSAAQILNSKFLNSVEFNYTIIVVRMTSYFRVKYPGY